MSDIANLSFFGLFYYIVKKNLYSYRLKLKSLSWNFVYIILSSFRKDIDMSIINIPMSLDPNALTLGSMGLKSFVLTHRLQIIKKKIKSI